jgi:hypothetical protein
MKLYKFHEMFYEEPYTPHFNDYKDKRFYIHHYSSEDEDDYGVYLICIDDPKIQMCGYMDFNMLEEVEVVIH